MKSSHKWKNTHTRRQKKQKDNYENWGTSWG